MERMKGHVPWPPTSATYTSQSSIHCPISQLMRQLHVLYLWEVTLYWPRLISQHLTGQCLFALLIVRAWLERASIYEHHFAIWIILSNKDLQYHGRWFRVECGKRRGTSALQMALQSLNCQHLKYVKNICRHSKKHIINDLDRPPSNMPA